MPGKLSPRALADVMPTRDTRSMTDKEIIDAARDRGWWIDKVVLAGVALWTFDGFDEDRYWATQSLAVDFMRARLAALPA